MMRDETGNKSIKKRIKKIIIKIIKIKFDIIIK
jgi:hypothetical protein